MLTISLLGPPRVARAGRVIDMRVRKELALLAYLAVEARHRHSREALVGLLWPDTPEDAARNSLRVALAELRRRLGEAGGPLLDADRQSVQFVAASPHTLDVAAFRELTAATRTHAHAAPERCDACLARLAEAVALYQGNFLHGFSLPDSAPFEEWVAIQREQLHQQQLAALDLLAAAHEQRGDYPAQAEYGRRQLALEPWRESAHAQVIRALWAMGQRGAALEQYEACRRILDAELGLEPAPELDALAQQIRTEKSAEFSVLSIELKQTELNTQPSALNFRELKQTELNTQHSTLNTQRHNLPAQLTSFIGRDEQLAALRQSLAHAHLITLTGATGSGKTRLAIELAAASLPGYPDGAWLAALEPLRDPALLPQAVAEALGLPLAASQPAVASLAAALQPKRLLLLLDNCEHMVVACHDLAERLLHACPGLTIIATSRELLHVAGELVWPVLPLAAPAAADQPPERLLGYESIQLFVERARAVDPGFALTAQNAPAVAQICRQLDSLPLAIELAAARVRHMPVETIAARLDDRFTLLAGGATAAGPPRLRAALDWSYALLSEPERACFRRLAVFAGGFTLPAAEQVAGDPGAPGGAAGTVELLAQLIDKSLVVSEQRPEGMRYRLLETMRAYAHEQLLAAGEAGAGGARHLAHYLQLAEQAEPQLVGPDQVAWLDLLAAEHANLRAAADWAEEHGDALAALRLVTALRYFWRVRGFYATGIDLLRRLLAHPQAAARTTTRARALNAAGYLEFVRGQPAQARELLEEALAIGRALAEPTVTAFALRYLSALANDRRDYAEARASGEESLLIYRALGAANDIAGSAMYLGDAVLAQGDAGRAEALYAESVAILRSHRNSIALPYPLRRLGFLALQLGRPDQAAALCAESLRLNLAVNDRQGVAACLVGLAASAVAAGHVDRAARLLGHAEVLLDALHTRLLPYDHAQHERMHAILGEQLGAPAFAAAQAAGRAQTIEQLLAEAGPAHAQGAGGRAPPAEPPPQPAYTEKGTERSGLSAELKQAELNTQHSTFNAPKHNLPAPITSFVGRADELVQVERLLAGGSRLVTLIGPGGAGKTRLSIAIGRHLLPRFTDGAWWVALVGVQPSDDPAIERGTLANVIAATLGYTLTGRSDPLDELAEALQERAALLVLGTCPRWPPSRARCSRPPQRCASSPPRASRWAWAARRCCAWRACPCRHPTRPTRPATLASSYSSTGRPSTRPAGSRAAPIRGWRGYAGCWMACRWRSSWRPTGSSTSPPTRSPPRSRPTWTSWRRARAMCPIGTAACGRCSTTPGARSSRPSSRRWRAWRYSAAASIARLRARWPRCRSPPWWPWSISRWCAAPARGATASTSCCASLRPSAWAPARPS
jgi:predicted ATPase/DNA-binding SARP family transcriptional activator